MDTFLKDLYTAHFQNYLSGHPARQFFVDGRSP